MALFMVFLFLLPVHAIGAGNDTAKTDYSVSVIDKRISVKAQNTDFKVLLKELGEKSGIEVQIFPGVADRKISVDVRDIPFVAVGTLLENMGIKNYGVAREGGSGKIYVYVVNAGTELEEVMKGKIAIRKLDFTARTDLSKVKGKEIVTSKPDKNGVSVSYIKDELLIKFKLGTKPEEIKELLTKYNLSSTDDSSLVKIGYIKATITDGKTVEEITKAVAKERIVKRPEPNFIQRTLAVTDPLYPDQWYVQNSRFDKAWEMSKSIKSITVAVIDSGVQADHPDLKYAILSGYDFVSNKVNAFDDNGHGTFVAGIIAARANDIGIKGLYANVRILPVKVMDANGAGTYEDTAKGIIYAADNGAKVINLSIGGYGNSSMLQEAVDYALSKGCIVVAAGGNDGVAQEIYPAAYPDVIGVGAISEGDSIWQYSNRGKHIDVVAPGVNVISTSLESGYAVASGTSAAAPVVSAMAALLATERPDLSASVIARIIQQSARDLGDNGRDNVYGSGAIDVQAGLIQQVTPFHDVAVRGLILETPKVSEGNSFILTTSLINQGTFSPEFCDVSFSRINEIGKQLLSQQNGVSVVSKKTVAFSWQQTDQDKTVEFEVSASCMDEGNLSNNYAKSGRYTVRTSGNLHVLYPDIPPVHGWIAYQAYKLLPDSSLKTEIFNYIKLDGGDNDPKLSKDFSVPPGWNDTYWFDEDNSTPYCPNAASGCDTALLEGAWEEDNPNTRSLNHFWDIRGGYKDGLGPTNPWSFLDADSAVMAANDRFKQSVDFYKSGIQQNKNIAFWWLGRTAHLLADMAAPAHSLKDPHARVLFGDILPKSSDSYENWLAFENNYKKIAVNEDNRGTFIIPSYQTNNHLVLKDLPSSSSYNANLTELFYNLSDLGNDYCSDDKKGEKRPCNDTSDIFISYGDNIWPTYIDIKSENISKNIASVKILPDKELVQGTDYEVHNSKLGGPNGEAVNRVYFGWNIIGKSDKTRITFVNNDFQEDSAFHNRSDLTETPNFMNYEIIPGTLLERVYQPVLEKNAISYVAALYQLFWEKTHLLPTIKTQGADVQVLSNVSFTGSILAGTLPTTWEWDFNYDGTTFNPDQKTGIIVNNVFKTSGMKRVALRVSEPGFEPAIVDININVTQYPINVTQPNNNPKSLTVNFTTPVSAAITNYNWSFGDGTTDTGTNTNPTHTYALPGTYTVTLTITATVGTESTVSTSTTEVTIQGNVQKVELGAPIKLEAAGTATDTYKWNLGSSTWSYPPSGVELNLDNSALVTGDTANWNTRYLVTKDTFARNAGDSFTGRITVKPGGNRYVMWGLKDSSTNYSYTQFYYAIYFVNNNIQIYESNNYRGQFATFSDNVSYDVKIDVKTAGASYYYRKTGDANWITLYNSTYSSASPFRVGATVHSGAINFSGFTSPAGNVNLIDALITNQQSVTASYYAVGSYPATVTVTNSAQQTTNSTTYVVVVNGEAPVAKTGGPYQTNVDIPTRFNARASTDDYGIKWYEWNFGDGESVKTRNPWVDHRYTVANSYTATLTVTDFAGHTASESTTVSVSADPVVSCVPWQFAGGTSVPHDTWNGKQITLKGVAWSLSTPLTYRWDFGDGTAAVSGTVADKRAIQATHIYNNIREGETVVATLTVTDSLGRTTSDQYSVRIRPKSLDVEMNVAIDEGLWWTHKNQNRSAFGKGTYGNATIDYGYWDNAGGWNGDAGSGISGMYTSSPTASSVQAFQVNGHLELGDVRKDPYVETVARGLRFTSSRMRSVAIGVQTYGDPDTNGNGVGVETIEGRPAYEIGQVMDCLVASGSRDTYAITGPTGIIGRSNYDLVTDMLDMYAWGQGDAASGASAGGWQYTWNGSSDNSVAQWGAIGMLAAEEVWKIKAPQWVKDRNNVFINATYNGVGFGYSGPGNGTNTTPSGMVQLAFDGMTGYDDPSTTSDDRDARWKTAEAYIANNWSGSWWYPNSNLNNRFTYYGYYAFAKAMRSAYPKPVVNLKTTGLDWFKDNTNGMARRLINRQQSDGSWPMDQDPGSYVGYDLTTAWSVLILTPTLFVQPPVADAGEDRIWGVDTVIEFDGSRSFHLDPSRKIVKYEWDLNGDGTFETSSTDPKASYNFRSLDYPSNTLPRVVNVTLRVTDDNDPPKSSTDSVKITLTLPPHPPYAVAGGPYTCYVGIPCRLDGSKSYDINPTDFITAWEWDTNNDRVYGDITGARPYITYTSPGTFIIGLRVTDNAVLNDLNGNGLPDINERKENFAFTTVTVKANSAPVSRTGGPYTVNEGVSILLDGSGSSDPDGNEITYSWDLDNDGIYETTGAKPTFLRLDNGTFTVKLKVSDGALESTSSTTVTVLNVAPTISPIQNATINEGSSFTVSGSFSDSGSDTWTATVNYGDGSGIVPLTLNADKSFLLNRGYPQNGTYTVVVTVTDKDGGVATKNIVVTVNNVIPVVSATPGTAIYPKGTFTGTGQFTDPGADTWTATVNYGDGTGGMPLALNLDKGFTLNHLYTQSGSFPVTIAVTDSDGGKGTFNTLATVLDDNTGPELSISALSGGSYTSVETLNFSGNVSDLQSGFKLLTVNGIEVPVDLNNNNRFTLPVTLVLGPNAFIFVAEDNSGNKTTTGRIINYDPNAPRLIITAPSDNSITNQSFTDVKGTIDENASVSVSVNTKSPELAALNGSDFSYSANLSPGTNTIEVTATDLAKNVSSAKRTVVYDNLSPSLAITVPSQDITTSQNSITLKGTVTDSLTDVTMTVVVDGASFNPPVVNGTFEQKINFTTQKSYTITATATDEAKNSTSVQRNVIYATQNWNSITPPIILTKSGTLYDSVNNNYFVNIALKNGGTTAIEGPIRLVITNPSIPVKTLQGIGLKPSGTSGAETYFEIIPTGGSLAPGATLSNQRVNFNNVRTPLTFGMRADQFK